MNFARLTKFKIAVMDVFLGMRLQRLLRALRRLFSCEVDSALRAREHVRKLGKCFHIKAHRNRLQGKMNHAAIGADHDVADLAMRDGEMLAGFVFCMG